MEENEKNLDFVQQDTVSEPGPFWKMVYDPDVSFEIDDAMKIYGDDNQRAKMFAAFSEYYGEVTNPDNTAVNAFFKTPNGQASKYAPLNEVLNTIRPIMAKHGLSATQVVSSHPDYGCKVTTLVMHKDGGCMVYPALQAKPGNSSNAIQSLGAALTYLRRFSLNAAAGVCGEVDDDGNSVTENKAGKSSAKEKTAREKIADLARAKAKKNRTKVDEIVKKYAEDGLIKNIPDDKIENVIKELEEIA